MKNITLLAVMLLLSTATFAQGKYQFSFIAGPQFSWMKSDSDLIESDGSRVGYAFGIISDRFLDNDQRYSIHSGFIVSTLGGKVKIENTANESNSTFERLKYKVTNIEVPISMKLRTAQFSRNTFFVQLGLTQWFNISDDIEYENRVSEAFGKNDLNFYNIGYNVGGGMEYDIGGDNALTLGVIFQNSFIDATKNNSIDDKMTFKNIRAQVGIVF